MDLQDEIWNWARYLPPWQQDLMRRLLERTSLDETELNQVFRIILAAHRIDDLSNPAEQPSPLKSENIPAAPQKGSSIHIRALGDFENVNAVEKKQRIDFEASGITIIYGDNTAGKSSYARVLKQACRAVDGSIKILPNVFAPNARSLTKGRAKITVESNGTEWTILREVNTSPVHDLTTISVFDSKCAQLYVDSENTIAYIPSSLDIFDRLAKTQSRLKGMIKEQLDGIQRNRPQFTEFTDDTSVKRRLDNLSYKTNFEEVKTIAILSDEEKIRIQNLEKELASLIASDPLKDATDLRRKASEAKQLKIQLETIVSGISDLSITQIKNADQKCITLRKAAQLASNEAFTNEPVKGVETEPWKVLWEAARDYSIKMAYPEQEFPFVTEVDARCVLCHQVLSEDAKDRFLRFEAFVKNKTKEDLKIAEDDRKKLLDSLEKLPLDAVEKASIRKLFTDENPELEIQISRLLESSRNRLAWIKQSCETHEWESTVPQPELAVNQSLDTWIATTEKRANEKQALAKPDEQAKIKSELKELKARLRLEKRLDDVYKFIEGEKQWQKLKEAQESLDTTAITNKQKDLLKKITTESFRRNISDELKALKFDKIRFRVGDRGEIGKTYVRLNLDSRNEQKVTDVLCESEQKALALAFFLAEIKTADHDGGMILDDPVSSFDHQNRDYVAKRLAEEGKKRQVIVFTHDIVFLLALQRYSELNGIKCATCTVRRAGDSIGLAQKELPWIAQKVKDRKGVLRNRIQVLEKLEGSGDTEEYRRQVKLWFELLREGWERAVEELLFNGVVQRFAPSVNTLQLKGVKVTQELIDEINKGMTESSAWVHDQAPGLNSLTPTANELMNHLKFFESFLEKFK